MITFMDIGCKMLREDNKRYTQNQPNAYMPENYPFSWCDTDISNGLQVRNQYKV